MMAIAAAALAAAAGVGLFVKRRLAEKDKG